MSRLRQWAVATACAPLVLLAGCPQQQAKAPVPANSTAPSLQAAAPAAQAQAPSAQPVDAEANAALEQKKHQLISRAESDYHSGVDNYNAGRLEAARSDFDLAVDTMLTSGMDLKNDPQLSDEFEHLLDSISSLEMTALKQGTGFSAPIEAAPLDAANEVTFPPDAALTAKVKEELKTTQSDFPLVVNDYVTGFINYFTNSPAGHAHLLRSLERAGKYKAMISKDLRAEGVPQDLIYLAVAESGFQPQVVNRSSGAGGMWQFMPFQGVYGLTRNAYFDERFDPEKSSMAYARYMKTLYDQFGDWYLAMAAYNWGAGNVQRAVMKTGYADFWELYKRNVLPQETKNYVPGIIAAIIMAKNPKQYGLDNLVPDPPVVDDTVTVNYPIDLHLVADLTDVPLSEIVDLNPSLLRMSTPEDMDFDLHLPAGTKDVFLKRVKEIPEDKRTTWRFHVVKDGESLDSVASLFHDRTSEIASANNLSPDASIDAGDELIIPERAASSLPRTLHYVTHIGDTLGTIADRFNVSVEDLRRWNHLSSTRIAPHRTLDVSEPVHLAPSTRSRRSRRAVSDPPERRRSSRNRRSESERSRASSTHHSTSKAKSSSHEKKTTSSKRSKKRK